MNIFEALSNGNGVISETNTSSFLAYLLNPSETHGLGNVFLEKFLKIIDTKPEQLKKLLNADYKEVILENSYNGRSAIIDIELIFSNNRDELVKPFHKICIENKIKKASKTDNQLNKYYQAIIHDEGDCGRVDIVYLTSYDRCFEKEFDSLSISRDGDKKSHIVWSCPTEEQHNITTLIRELLQEEANAKISPISDYLKQTLKAFCYYIENPVRREKIRRTAKLMDDGKAYTVIQYSTQRIEMLDENEEKVTAMPIFKRYFVKNPNAAILGYIDAGKEKQLTTWDYGRIFFNSLNSDQ